jgi:hypothetical protein
MEKLSKMLVDANEYDGVSLYFKETGGTLNFGLGFCDVFKKYWGEALGEIAGKCCIGEMGTNVLLIDISDFSPVDDLFTLVAPVREMRKIINNISKKFYHNLGDLSPVGEM